MQKTLPINPTTNSNRTNRADRAIHDWYQFVLGYPPHLVSHYLEFFGADPADDVVYDPFCGTGTTPVEAKKKGFRAVGTDANPIAAFAAGVKTEWNINLKTLEQQNEKTLERFQQKLAEDGLEVDDFPLFNGKPKSRSNGDSPPVNMNEMKEMLHPDVARVMPHGFISPLPHRKILALTDIVQEVSDDTIRNLYRLAIAGILVETVGNVGFGPEVYMTKAKLDAPVFSAFASKLRKMTDDLCIVQKESLHKIPTHIVAADARNLGALRHGKFDIVITSPPYPNEKDYTRSTRLESIALGFINSVADLRQIKTGLLKSNTRTIHKGANDDEFVQHFASIQKLAEEIEARRIALGKTSGFERLYHRVVRLYFGGMYRHLKSLKPHLNRGAKLAYVVGDQMSFFRIHIKTGQLLAEIADDLGYKVVGIDLWRERLSTTTRLMLREEVVLLEKR